VLRKILWSSLLAGIAGLTAMVSQRVAAIAWRLATGDHPPDTSK
jgi:hypothetical protein